MEQKHDEFVDKLKVAGMPINFKIRNDISIQIVQCYPQTSTGVPGNGVNKLHS